MNDISRRILASIGGGVVLLATYAVVYQWGMTTFEEDPVSYVQALQVVLESLTTAGFGGDAPWLSTVVNLIVIGMNLTGVLLVFFTVPFFLVPLLEGVFETAALQAELAPVGVPSLFVKSDVDVVGDITDTETLRAADVAGADSVVLALSRDSLAVFAALVIDEHGPDVETLVRAGDSPAVARTTVGGLAGRRLGDAAIRERTGATVVAVERNGTVHANPDPAFELEAGDVLIVVGSQRATSDVTRAFDHTGTGR
jgi:hypothetical protein